MNLVCRLLDLVVLVIFLWIVLGWVVGFGRVPGGHPVRRVYDAVASVINPVLQPIRRLLPALRMGGMALDLSPIVLVLGIVIIQNIICR